MFDFKPKMLFMNIPVKQNRNLTEIAKVVLIVSFHLIAFCSTAQITQPNSLNAPASNSPTQLDPVLVNPDTGNPNQTVPLSTTPNPNVQDTYPAENTPSKTSLNNENQMSPDPNSPVQVPPSSNNPYPTTPNSNTNNNTNNDINTVTPSSGYNQMNPASPSLSTPADSSVVPSKDTIPL